MDVLLVNPPSRPATERVEPLGLPYIAAFLRQEGFEVEMLDAPSQPYDFKRTAQEILRRDFKLLGISIPMQEQLEQTLSLIDHLRVEGLDAHITIGGHPPTFTFERILRDYPSVDSVVRGEGELTVRELAEAIGDGRDWTSIPGIAYRKEEQPVLAPPRPLIRDLDDLPWPARDVWIKTTHATPFISVLSSRGCYHNCSFCSIGSFYKLFPGPRWRARGAEQVVDEIEFCLKDLKTDCVFFIDDTFIGAGEKGRNRAYEIAREITKRRLRFIFCLSCRSDAVNKELFAVLKEAGLNTVFLGIESGNQRALDIFNKKATVEQNRQAIKTLQELAINCSLGFIMVNPYATLDEIRQDIAFLREMNCGPELAHLTSLSVFPGISLVDRLERDGLLRSSTLAGYDYDFMDERVQVFAKLMTEGCRCLFPVFDQLVALQHRISTARPERNGATRPETDQRELLRLKSDFGRLVEGFLDGILESAARHDHFSAQKGQEPEESMHDRLADLSRQIAQIEQLPASTS